MDDGIYAVVRRYMVGDDVDSFADWEYKPNDYDNIYNKVMELTGGDHEISSDLASWCELASIGEIYMFREGEIEIMKID